jgi:serine protease Do
MVNQLENQLVAIAQHLKSITVEIFNSRGGGSGVVWGADGLIITNAHVVRSSKVDIKLEDETIVKGAVIARDNRQDLAAIKIDVESLPTPSMGNSDNVRPGELVLAMGSPLGFAGTLTVGVVHATPQLEHFQELGLSNSQSYQPTNSNGFIVADVRLAPGNSGGVLADARGRVIGTNTAIFHGLALAIPSRQVQDFIKANVP